MVAFGEDIIADPKLLVSKCAAGVETDHAAGSITKNANINAQRRHQRPAASASQDRLPKAM